MQKFLYVSPSIIPSKSANSVHVLHQVSALAEVIEEVDLVFATTEDHFSVSCIQEFYGVSLPQNVKVQNLRIVFGRAIQLQICLWSIYLFLRHSYSYILSRNLYFSTVLSIFSVQHVYEAHGIEVGWRRIAEQLVFKTQTKLICISQALREIIRANYGVSEKQEIQVLHDCCKINFNYTKPLVLTNDVFRVGYFGHLYPGRGVDIVLALADLFPQHLFYLAGGNDADIKAYKAGTNLKNVNFLGHLKNTEARSLMADMDALLMPYQNKVSIGTLGSDTSKWMSPLKMFEDMSSHTPFISSDLAVLREVLTNNRNCIMVPCDDIDAWSSALNKLQTSSALRERLANQAYCDVSTNYTWDIRARRILEFCEK